MPVSGRYEDSYRGEAEEQLTLAAGCLTEVGHGSDDVTPRALLAVVAALLAIDDSLTELNETAAAIEQRIDDLRVAKEGQDAG